MSSGWVERLKGGLSRTREATIGRIAAAILRSGRLDEATLESVEESLLLSDVGPAATSQVIESLKEAVKNNGNNKPDQVMKILQENIAGLLAFAPDESAGITVKPLVILVVGVNGVGKTTTIGKMAHQFARQNKKVLLAAADSFRAAAGDQLEIWSKRAGVSIIRNQESSDPAAIVFDAVNAACAREMDVLIIDTAGRLHTKSNLMEELKKIIRVLKRKNDSFPQECLLVLDATTGQNGLNQAKAFKETANCTGIVVTKLDGTAKGGIIVPIQTELNIPVKMIGVGEGVEDLKPFAAKEYAAALFDLGE